MSTPHAGRGARGAERASTEKLPWSHLNQSPLSMRRQKAGKVPASMALRAAAKKSRRWWHNWWMLDTKCGFQDGNLTSDMSKQARQSILEDNSLDLELYNHAVAIFEKRYAEYTAAVGKRERRDNKFTCNVDEMMCKKDKGVGTWMRACSATL